MTNQSGEQTAEQPLDVLAEQYRAELKRLNYGRATINVYLRTIRKLGQLIGSHDLPLDQLTPDIAAELVLRADWHGDRRQYAIFIVRRFVGYLRTLGLAKPPVPPTARELARAALRRDYEDYLRRQRGLTEQTIGHCWRFADRFLDFRFGETEVELGAITAGDIVAFLQRLTTRKPPYRDKTAPTHLRNFFRHLFKAGLTKSNLALCIPSVAQHYDARLPRHLTPEQVETVLAAVRADDAVRPPQLCDDHPPCAPRPARAGSGRHPTRRYRLARRRTCRAWERSEPRSRADPARCRRSTG